MDGGGGLIIDSIQYNRGRLPSTDLLVQFFF